MSFPKFYVTYCVMDTDAGANPFGHTCLIFSQQENDKSPIKVNNSIGYYSQPSTSTNPFFKGLKQLIGLNVDLQDGHGILKQEAMRNIDGKGLQGISFEVTQQQFTAVSSLYQQMMKTEQEVINELNIELATKGIKANGYTRYIAEKKKAETEGRPPRLKPFHIAMKLTLNGFDSSDSYTCKDHSLELLSLNHIIPEEIRNQLISNRATTAFPRFSSLYLPPIRLISTGEFVKTTSKNSGTIFYNHEWEKSSLFWASSVNTLKTTESNGNTDPNKSYALLNNMLHSIREVEDRLLHGISAIEDRQDIEQLRQLKIQFQRVQNLSYFFNNSYENQIPELLEERLLKAEKVLRLANWAMNPIKDRVNYSFLLRAYESTCLYEALVGMLAMALSTAAILVTPVGIGLLVASTAYTARQLYGFYKEESELTRMSQDYNNSLNQEPDSELLLVSSIN